MSPDKTDQLFAAPSTIKELADEDPQIRSMIASQLAFDQPPAHPPAKKGELPSKTPEIAPKDMIPSSGMYEADAGEGEGEEEEHFEDDPEEKVEPEPEKPVNSSTHRKEHARLVRKMASVDGATCPEMVRLWGGSRTDKTELLRKWIASGENLAACESSLILQKTQEGELEKGKELLTIREMIDKNFSQFLGCVIDFFEVTFAVGF